MAMELIETIEVGSGGASSIEFTSIPQDGLDLLLVFSLRNDSASGAVRLWENGNTAQGSNRMLTGDGSGVYSFSGLTYIAIANGSGTTANTFGNGRALITNYTSTNTKSISIDAVQENDASSSSQAITTASSYGTAAITSLELSYTAGNIVQYSTASLYKIS